MKPVVSQIEQALNQYRRRTFDWVVHGLADELREESMIGAGRLHDAYEKVGEEWKFRSQRVEIIYFVPLSEGWAKVLK